MNLGRLAALLTAAIGGLALLCAKMFRGRGRTATHDFVERPGLDALPAATTKNSPSSQPPNTRQTNEATPAPEQIPSLDFAVDAGQGQQHSNRQAGDDDPSAQAVHLEPLLYGDRANGPTARSAGAEQQLQPDGGGSIGEVLDRAIETAERALADVDDRSNEQTEPTVAGSHCSEPIEVLDHSATPVESTTERTELPEPNAGAAQSAAPVEAASEHSPNMEADARYEAVIEPTVSFKSQRPPQALDSSMRIPPGALDRGSGEAFEAAATATNETAEREPTGPPSAPLESVDSINGPTPPSPGEGAKQSADAERETPPSFDIERPPHDAQSPRQYRPPVRQPARPRSKTSDAGAPRRNRALPLELRLVREKGRTWKLSLLPRRSQDLPEQIEVSGPASPPDLIILQQEWFQDVPLRDGAAVLRSGAEWRGTLPDGSSVRWVLSGRGIYVLSRHAGVSGFVGTTRLILGEDHVVLCQSELLSEVKELIEQTGSPEPTILSGADGMPTDWIGLAGVFPKKTVEQAAGGAIFDVLLPLADIKIVLEGGIRFDRSIWLKGYPPRIRIQSDVGECGGVVIDGREAEFAKDAYVAAGWDDIGDHQVWCPSESRSYSIHEGAQHWDAWDAYSWSIDEFEHPGLVSRPAVCGAIVMPPGAEADSRVAVVPSSNPIVVGTAPGQVAVALMRCDISSDVSLAFTRFEPVWALPRNPLRCSKRKARVLFVGAPGTEKAGNQKLSVQRFQRSEYPMLIRWSSVILDAAKKGLAIVPADAALRFQWSKSVEQARAVRRLLR